MTQGELLPALVQAEVPQVVFSPRLKRIVWGNNMELASP